MPVGSPLSILSLRGGMNDTDTPSSLPEDQCVIANNVEFFFSMLGERRRGCEPFGMGASAVGGEAVVVALAEFYATNDVTAPQLWAVGATAGVSASVSYWDGAAWNNVVPADAINVNAPYIYNIVMQPLNGKLFFAYQAATPINRLHVWDGTQLRRTGLAQPAPPTAADGGGAGVMVIRYYRVRYIIKSGSKILVRSEPSTAIAFTPAGANSVTVTKPATISEFETHWELEASPDNANFYRIATLAVGTATYSDTANPNTYATTGVLSDAIGAYALQPAARYLSVDDDRLLWAGNFTDATQDSVTGWSPTAAAPGVGNDERNPVTDTGGTNIVSTLTLDTTVGGPITGISQAENGTWYANKWSRIYRLSRTLDETQAYKSQTLTTKRGSLTGSLVSGQDENGRGCVYFIDPQFGPSRVGLAGIQTLRGLRNTWRRTNVFATKVIVRGVYYPDKQQVHWWLAADANDSPTLKIILQVTETRSQGEGAIRGWSIADGRIAQAYAVCTFNEKVTGDPTSGVVALRARPFIGLTTPDLIQRCDVQTTDAGYAYRAMIVSRAYAAAGLLNFWGAMVGAVLAVSNTTFFVQVSFIRDFGIETNSVITDLLPSASETEVVKVLDELVMSEAHTIQVAFSDPI